PEQRAASCVNAPLQGRVPPWCVRVAPRHWSRAQRYATNRDQSCACGSMMETPPYRLRRCAMSSLPDTSDAARSGTSLADTSARSQGLARDTYFFPSAAPDSFAVVARSGERRRFGSAPASFTVRVRDLSAWYALAGAGAYRIATAFVAGELDIDGDLLAAVRWWHQNHLDGWRGWVRAAVGRLRLDSWMKPTGRVGPGPRFQDDSSNRFYEQFLDS